MVAADSPQDDAVMAPSLERYTPWLAETGGQASPPAVVCALNGSRPGRAAAAYAAALARALGWSLGLVASGLRPLELPMLAQAVVDENAGIVVQPGERRGTASHVGELALRVGVPVVVVPQRHDEPGGWSPVVAIAAADSAEIVGQSTRLALALEAALRIVHAAEADDVAELLERACALGAALVVVDARRAASVRYRRLGVPVMFVPTPG